MKPVLVGPNQIVGEPQIGVSLNTWSEFIYLLPLVKKLISDGLQTETDPSNTQVLNERFFAVSAAYNVVERHGAGEDGLTEFTLLPKEVDETIKYLADKVGDLSDVTMSNTTRSLRWERVMYSVLTSALGLGLLCLYTQRNPKLIERLSKGTTPQEQNPVLPKDSGILVA